MRKRITLFTLASLLMYCCAAQTDQELIGRLQGKNNIHEVSAIIDNYYNDPRVQQKLGMEAVQRQLKRWKRWEWYVSSRTAMNGDFVNINEKMMNANARRSIASRAGDDEPVNESTAGNWSLIGPTTSPSGIGRTDRIAFHPSDPNTIYVGASGGGLWKTTNGGTNWTCLTNDLPSLGVSGIVVHPGDPNIIYILTGDGDSDVGGLVEDFGYMHLSIGVLKTTDGGLTWQPTGTFPGPLGGLNGYQLIRNPFNANMLFAATNRGLFRTTDAGVTWTEQINELCYDVVFKPNSSTTCYALTRTSGVNHFYLSTDAGSTWNPTTGTDALLANKGRCKLAVASSSNGLVYILAGGVPDTAFFGGVFRSTTSGTNFTLMSNAPNILGRSSTGNDDVDQSGYDLAMAVHPDNASFVVTGGVRIWRNPSGGAPFNWVYEGGADATHDDIHDLKFNPLDNKLWAATDGGTYYSTDAGGTWTPAFDNLSITQFYHMSVRPDDYLKILGGTQDNGVKYRSANNANFDHIASADGYFSGFDAADNSIFYAILNSNVARFTNNGADRTTINPPGNQLTEFFPSMAVHTSAGNTLWVGSDSIWRTTNGGTSWSITPDIPAGWFFRSCPSNGNRLYIAGGNSANNTTVKSLRRSDDGGLTWPAANILHDNPGFPADFPKITCINVDPTTSARVWVTFGGFEAGTKVYYSDDFGGTWTNRSGTLPNVPINCIALDNSNNAYIGTDHGVYYRGANMTDWVPFYNNLPYSPVTTLVISQTENRIRASTFGRGIWSSDLYSTCPPSLNIIGTLEGQEFYEASGNVSSTAKLQNSVGTKVGMRSATGVVLSPGFSAPANTVLKASIGPCGSGSMNDFRMADGNMNFEAQKMIRPLTHIAAIEPVSANSNQVQAKLRVGMPGNVQVFVSSEAGGILAQMQPKNYSSKATESIQLSLPALAKGLYYIHVVHNGQWVHFQELEIK